MSYDTTKVTDELSIEKILTKTNYYSIFKHYLSQPIKINKPISSPFREDRNPSWSIFETKLGEIMYKDFATGESGGVVKFVQRLFTLNYPQALKRIWEDLVAKTNPIKTVIPIISNDIKKKVSMTIKRKYFTQTDLDYWSQYGITKDTLKKFNVTPIDAFWVNDLKNRLVYTKEQPMYAYKSFDKFKIYRPYSIDKKDKWRNNCGYYDVQGIEQLPESDDLLIITKSLKDVMTLYELGYSAIAPQSEQSPIPSSIMTYLKFQFLVIIILYDNDNGGIEGAKKLSEKHDLKTLFIPKHYLDLYDIKDISDCVKEIGINKTKELLEQLTCNTKGEQKNL